MGRFKKIFSLFMAFLKIGLFTFGGGYAMIAFIEAEFVEKRKLMEHDEFLDLVVIAESTPGPIAINAATYIGYKTSGFLGALSATVAVCSPSVAIIYAISLFFDAFLQNQIVANAFKGIQVCVIYLILSAGIKMHKKMKKTRLSVFIVTLTLISMILLSAFAVKFSSICFILMGAVAGVSVYLVSKLKNKSKKTEVEK